MAKHLLLQVEKQHANVQLDLKNPNHSCRRPSSIQQQAFIMSVVLEHSRLKSAVEDEVLGPSKQRVFRVLRGRLVSTTAPAATLSRKRKGQRLAPLKRRTGVLRGVTDFQCGLVRKAHFKTRRVSGYNAFQAVCK